MSTSRRRTHAALIDRLATTPQRFEFVQATRIVLAAAYRLDQRAGTVGSNTPPTHETLRLENHATLRFPTGELNHASAENQGGQQRWRLGVNAMGLTGANGVLPYHYSELLLRRARAKDLALKHFLGLFEHRTLSLFFRASTKYRLPVAYEQGKRDRARAGLDSLSFALHALVGLAEPASRERQTTPDEGLLRHAGLLVQRPRSAIGLRRLLEGHFRLPFRVEEFKGQWHDLMDAARTRLPGPGHPLGMNNRLGDNALLGRRAWFVQGRIEIVIGPLSRAQFDRLTPGGPTLQAIDEMVRFYVGVDLDYAFVVLLHREHLPDQPALGNDQPPVLGWNSWISGQRETAARGTHLAVRVGSRCRSANT